MQDPRFSLKRSWISTFIAAREWTGDVGNAVIAMNDSRHDRFLSTDMISRSPVTVLAV
jgi:hypothetical protein